MKRSMSKSQQSTVVYQPLNADEINVLNTEIPKMKNKWLCASSRKRMYVLMFMSGIALSWIFIYYKLLNHRFVLPEPLRELQKMFGDGEVKTRRSRLDETENVEESSIDVVTNCLPQFQTPRSKHEISIVLVACKRARVNQAIVSMKAITSVTNSRIMFHIFTDDEHYENRYFDRELEKWPSFSSERWMMFITHPIHYPFEDLHEQDVWYKLFKPCASQRLFLPAILTSTDAVLYVDTDVLFLSPPEQLWDHFENFNDKHLAGMAPECENGHKGSCWYKNENSIQHPFVQPHGINSGVMLMNLTRMRQRKWILDIQQINKEYEKIPLPFGDQDILNIFFEEHRELLYIFSCMWNYRPVHCLHQVNGCKDATKNGISALQGNHEAFLRKPVCPEFYAIYEAYEKYKNYKSGKSEKQDFQMKVVNKIQEDFESKHFKNIKNSKCNLIKNQVLRNIQCNQSSEFPPVLESPGINK